MPISPNDILPNGTKVKVGNKRGIVTNCETVRAVPSGFISVHTIAFYERQIGTRQFPKIVPINETKKVNYSFIETP